MPFIGKTPETGAFRLIDSITTSATDTYALTVQGDHYFPESARNLIVSLNGVTQAPESAYTVSGSHIVFASALTANDVIDYILVIGDAVDIGTPSDGTVGNAQLKASLDLSGKTLTFSNDQISGDAIDGGTISNFASAGIDDNATSTAITIDSSQNLGIGIVPSSTYGRLRVGDDNSDINMDGNAKGQFHIDGNGYGFGVALNTLGAQLYTNSASRSVIFGTDETERMRVNGSGNVGIGVTDPQRTLHVHTGSGSSYVSITNGTTGSTATDGVVIGSASDSVAYFWNYENAAMGFATNNSERMRIDSLGNVGIGTNTPNTYLSNVSGSAKGLTIEGAVPVLALKDTSASDDVGYIYQSTNDMRMANYAGGSITFNIGSSFAELFSIESDGALHAQSANTGTNPAANSHIASELRFFNTSATDNNLNAIGFYNSNQLIDARIAAVHKSHSSRQGELVFMTHSGSELGERMRIDSSGNVGIGTTTINNPLTVKLTPNTNTKTSGSAFDGGAVRLTSTNGLSGANSEMAILAGAEDTLSAGIGFARQDGSTWGTQIRFYTHGTAITTTDELTERMRLDASGNLIVGAQSHSLAGKVTAQVGSTGRGFTSSFAQANGTNVGYWSEFTGSSGDAYHMYLRYNSSNVGLIWSNSSSTTYGESSDYRLKENVVPLENAIDRVKQIPVHRFNFIVAPDRTVDGFLAHEVGEFVPEAIIGEKDGMTTEEYEVTPEVLDEEGNVVEEAVMGTREVPQYQHIDKAKLVPLLTAAIKEQQTIIEDLQTRLSALEAN